MHDRGLYRYIMMHNREAWRNGTLRILNKREALLEGIQGSQGKLLLSLWGKVHDGYNALKEHLGMEE